MTDVDPNQSLGASEEPDGRCGSCDSPLLPDQRYCLHCGARRGTPRLDFTSFWRRRGPTGGRRPADGDGGSHDGGPSSANGSPRLPSRKVTGLLVGLALGAGIAVGAAIGPGPASSRASSGLPSSVLGAIAAAESRKAQAASEAAADKGSSAKEAVSDEPQTEAETETSNTESEQGSSGESEAAEGETSEETTEEETTSEKEPSKSESGSTTGKEKVVSSQVLSQISHVWVISLSGSSFQQVSKQASSDPYLAKKLIPKGTLLSDYSLVGKSAIANEIALLSGQASNSETEAGCLTYGEMQPQELTSKGLTEGVGCVYPATVKTLADQTGEAALTWKAYIQDMASAGSGSSSTSTTTTSTSASETTSTTSTTSTDAGEASTETCRHPAIGTTEAAVTPSTGDDYLVSHNPFVYFDSLLSSGACTSDDVDLTTLKTDLAESKDTPNLNWISPSACDDGEATKCGPKGSSGLAAADRFLEEVVPEIMATSDYKSHGLILITFDSGPTHPTGTGTGSSSESGSGPTVGALLISPIVKQGVKDTKAFNTYSLLKSLERLFGVPLLGHANDEDAEELGAGVYSTSAKAAAAAVEQASG